MVNRTPRISRAPLLPGQKKEYWMANNKQKPENTPAEAFRHVRTNPKTGEKEYYCPLEITDPSIRALAREEGLEICRTRLGSRVIEAAMVPCKNVQKQKNLEAFTDTSPDEQRRLYLAYIRDELSRQDARRQDGRCNIPDGKGGLKRCPTRKPNPAYTPGSGLPKTLPNPCQGCRNEPYRQKHSTVPFLEDAYQSRRDPFAADHYMAMRKDFLALVKKRAPKLHRLASLLTLEYSKSEAARELGLPVSTVASQVKKLQELLTEFRNNQPMWIH